MSQTLVTKIFRNTGEIGFPTKMLAYRLNISFVVKSILSLSFARTYSLFDAVSSDITVDYLIRAALGNAGDRREWPIKLGREALLLVKLSFCGLNSDTPQTLETAESGEVLWVCLINLY